ncbi:heparan-alpha-glucosaminide N-acetyltransferase domain-containing protein [Pseudonocardia adelaidensis]|uniref:Heparan-alpha-glucosaminide N-acetyltransferase catalytic domain-containing protein n=1 Tax=Pseudonocardia adelaidensis TaxID=648754 RepID=A0ABP9NF66_9PSEU
MTGARPAAVGREVPTSRRSRIVGVDAARAVALAGMFATHIFPLRVGREPTLTGLVASGRASALFAVLAGVGVALATGGTQRPEGNRAHLAAGAALVVRGILVGALGLTLVALDAPVAIILAYYGVLFVVAAVLLRAPRGVLAAGAVLACVLTPVASQLLRAGLPDGPGDQVGWPALAEPGAAVVTLVLTGYYPVLTWTTYLLAGLAVGRLDLRRPQVATGLLTGGVALAVAAHTVSSWLLGPGDGVWVLGAEASARRYGTTPTGNWWWLAVDSPHSGSTLDLAATTGSALAVLGAMLLLSRWAPRPMGVPAALGSAPLTLYTLHVVALAVYAGSGSDDLVLWVGHVLVATLIGIGLRLAGLRGPLEAVVAAAGRAVRRGVSGVTSKAVDSTSPGPPST